MKEKCSINQNKAEEKRKAIYKRKKIFKNNRQSLNLGTEANSCFLKNKNKTTFYIIFNLTEKRCKANVSSFFKLFTWIA